MKSPEFNWSFSELGSGWCPGHPGSAWSSQKASFPRRRRRAGPKGQKQGWLSWHGLNPCGARVLLETEWTRAGRLRSCLVPQYCSRSQLRLLFYQPVWFQKFAIKLLLSIHKHISTFFSHNLTLKPTAAIFSIFTSFWKQSDCFYLFVLVACHPFHSKCRFPPQVLFSLYKNCVN